MNQAHLMFVVTRLQLGMPVSLPCSVYGSRSGSFMWKVATEIGNYAIKQLAPAINLKSEMIIKKYELTETIVNRFKQHAIPAVSTIQRSGNHLVNIENTGYLVYPWINGNNWEVTILSFVNYNSVIYP